MVMIMINKKSQLSRMAWAAASVKKLNANAIHNMVHHSSDAVVTTPSTTAPVVTDDNVSMTESGVASAMASRTHVGKSGLEVWGKVKATSAHGYKAKDVPCISFEDEENHENGSCNFVINAPNKSSACRTGSRAKAAANCMTKNVEDENDVMEQLWRKLIKENQ